MEVEEEYADTGGSGVMVSNLPLLFSSGSPSSLCDMVQSELEVFVPFMVKCSVGEEGPVPWSQLPRPAWWPKKLPFRMPPSRCALIGLVERCYSFHGCDYLLQFCASLVAQMPPAGYRFNDNRDGTTSMYHGNTGKLLVTFRNENRDYDKYRHGGKGGRDTTKKLLLSPTSTGGGGGGGGGGGASTAMIQPPVTDIYLCDKCENEFYSLKEVQAHERHCCGEVPSSPPTPSPEPEVPEEEPEPTDQVPFLSYFNLRPAQHTGLEPHMSPRKKSVSSTPAKLPGPIYPRYDTIPLTSPLGRYLFAHSKFRNKYQASQHSVMRYERHLHATPNADINYRERCNSRWIVVWRSRKERPPWVHLYCFNRAQRRERSLTLQTGLTRESRFLLKLCRRVEVSVKRLPKRTVDRVLRQGVPTTAPCIDLTVEQQQLVPHTHQSSLDSWMASQRSHTQANVELQWVTGLPNQSGACVASGSGSTTFPPPYASQPSLRNMVDLNVGHHSSLNFTQLPVMPGTTQHQQLHLPPGLTIQPSPVSSRPLPPPLPHVSNNSQVKEPHSLSGHQGSGRLHFPFTADVSISPIVGPARPTRSQLEADLMKPLSRKKFPDLLGATIHKVNNHEWRPVPAMPATQPLVPPYPPDWERVAPPVVGEGNSLSLTHTCSSIEVIDLSSDEDDYGRGGHGHSEAANAPQQLDGLACYPHTGAKVPSESSEYSLSKNGNSHWSSQQKSHCGAGRVGDLATNGQPPNVLPSPLKATPSPSPSPCHQDTHTNTNHRKRKIEEDFPPPRGVKTIILDISSQGVVVSKKCTNIHIASDTSQFGLPHTEEAVVVSVVPPPSNHPVISTHTNSRPDPCKPSPAGQDGSPGRQGSGRGEAVPTSPQRETVKFLSTLVNKGVQLFKSLIGTDGVPPPTPPGVPAGSGYHRGRPAPHTPPRVSRKKSKEVQKLLGDECRELQRGGLRELSHLDVQGIRLTRRSAGHILPRTQLPRKNLGPRLGENRPPNRNGIKARREEGRGGRRESVSCSSLSFKDAAAAAALAMDENGNSASYMQAAAKQLGGDRECPSQSGRGGVPECPREWKVGPLTLDKSEGKFSNGHVVVGKSTAFSEMNFRNCEVMEKSCSNVRGNSVTNNLQYTKCSSSSADSNIRITPTQTEGKKKDSFCVGPLGVRGPSGVAGMKEQPVCVAKGKVVATLWDVANTNTTPSMATIKITNLPHLGKDVASLSPRMARPELTGETAEECGAQLALCPLPDQQQHHPAGSGTPPATPDRPCLTLLHSIRNSPAGKHQRRPSTPDRESQPHLRRPAAAKPHSTNRRKPRLVRELMSLGRDEYKEIQGTGFHPSDLLGHEEVKYLSVSSDEDDTPSPFPLPAGRQANSRIREPAAAAASKVSSEVARLLKDECKELQDRECSKAEWELDKERVRCRSMHPMARLAHSPYALLERTREPRGGSGRSTTRSWQNTHPVVEMFTPRDSHRHLLRSEVAMCVLNYELPNIH